MSDSAFNIMLAATEALAVAQRYAALEAERTAWRMELVDAAISRGEIQTFEQLREAHTKAMQGYRVAAVSVSHRAQELAQALDDRGLER